MLKYILVALFLALGACSDYCPSGDAPYVDVCFKGTWKIKKVYGVGGGLQITPTFEDYDGLYNSSACDTSFILQLAIVKDTTKYVFEHDTGKDTLTISHKSEAGYTKKCGLYFLLKRMQVEFPATTFDKAKVQFQTGSVFIKQ
jgi:hypothetical protein